MLLRMLGYTVSDVGPFWPNDYIAKAESLDLNEGASSYGASDAIKRGDAAILLLNTLQASPKDGDALLMHNISKSVEDSILLSTDETDSDLRKGQASFYESGSIITRPMQDTLDKALIGTRGTVLFDKNTPSKVRAFVPDSGNVEIVEVGQSKVDSLESKDGQTYKVPRKTQVVLNGELLDYGESYFDLNGRTVNLYYDSEQQLELISVAYGATESRGFLYGTENSANIPQNYKILKNGVEITRDSIQKYDFVSINGASRTAVVTDRRVTGYLEDAAPSFGYPEKIRILGHDFHVTESASASFRDMKYNDKITLLLDSNGNVQAALPASQVSADMVGVFARADGKTATVELMNNIKITGTVDQDTADTLIGRFVRVTPGKSGRMTLSDSNVSSKVNGDWSISAQTLGSKTVSPSVKIYESVHDSAPAVPISIDDIGENLIPSKKIRATIADTSGNIVGVVLDDVTGYGWQYGIGSSSRNVLPVEGRDDDASYTTYAVILTCWSEDDAGEYVSTKKTYPTLSLPSGLASTPIGVPRGMDLYDTKNFLPVKKLKNLGTVSVSAFDGSDGVRTASGYYPLQKDIGVYIADYQKMVSLRDAKSNFTSFTLYADDTLENGGRVRVITAD